MNPSPTEVLILNLLIANVRGAYGSQLVNESDGRLKRTGIYTLLERLEKRGYVEAIAEPPTAELALGRTRFKITGEGRLARDRFAHHTGFHDVKPAGA